VEAHAVNYQPLHVCFIIQFTLKEVTLLFNGFDIMGTRRF